MDSAIAGLHFHMLDEIPGHAVYSGQTPQNKDTRGESIPGSCADILYVECHGRSPVPGAQVEAEPYIPAPGAIKRNLQGPCAHLWHDRLASHRVFILGHSSSPDPSGFGRYLHRIRAAENRQDTNSALHGKSPHQTTFLLGLNCYLLAPSP
jgi:hypothetical protein